MARNGRELVYEAIEKMCDEFDAATDEERADAIAWLQTLTTTNCWYLPFEIRDTLSDLLATYQRVHAKEPAASPAEKETPT